MSSHLKKYHDQSIILRKDLNIVSHKTANLNSNLKGVTMTLFCTHGRVSGPSSLLDLEVMAPRGYSVPCQF